jgi:murein L,D-transpeptidase YafK
MKKMITALMFMLLMWENTNAAQVKYIKVSKEQRLLELVDTNDQVIKSYKIMLGRNPVGHKTQEGDFKTPEGEYMLDYKNPKSKFHKSIHVSYPNKADIKRARLLGVRPGGDIMVHGLPNDFKEMRDWLATIGMQDTPDFVIRAALPFLDWTSGCIAVMDDEIDEIYSLVKVPTPIRILP